MKIYSKRSIFAMATVNPKLCSSLSIRVEVVQGGEVPNPHVHVYLAKSASESECSYVDLRQPKYAKHHVKSGKKLNKNQKKDFIRVMTVPCTEPVLDVNGNPTFGNGYQYAAYIWDATYGDGTYKGFTLDENGLPVMPDYRKLKASAR